LKADDSEVRKLAVLALGEIGIVNIEIITALFVAWGDKDKLVVTEIVHLFEQKKLKAVNDDVLNLLLAALENEKMKGMRGQLAYTLGHLGAYNKYIIDGLLGVLKGGDKNERLMSSWASGVGDKEIVAALLRALNDKYAFVRRRAAWALGKLGKGNAEVARALLIALNDKDEKVRMEAAIALANIGIDNGKVVDELAKVIKGGDIKSRLYAIFALGDLQSKNSMAVKVLLAALMDSDNYIPLAALGSLKQMGISYDEAIAKGIISHLQSKRSDVLGKAILALGNLGVNNDDIVRGLSESLKNKNSTIRGYSAFALGAIKARSAEVVNTLREASINDNDSDVSLFAAWALANIGVDSLEFGKRVVAAFEDNRSYIRKGGVVLLWRSSSENLRLLSQVQTEKIVQNLLVAVDDLSDEELTNKSWDVLSNIGTIL
jgi:HEAT repeat protein